MVAFLSLRSLGPQLEDPKAGSQNHLMAHSFTCLVAGWGFCRNCWLEHLHVAKASLQHGGWGQRRERDRQREPRGSDIVFYHRAKSPSITPLHSVAGVCYKVHSGSGRGTLSGEDCQLHIVRKACGMGAQVWSGGENTSSHP